MRYLIARPARLLALLAVTVLLAGCGSVTNKIGTAAIVGNTRISDTAVQSWFNAVVQREPNIKGQLQQQGETLSALGRRLATLSVQEELVRQAAATEHLTVDERAVDAALAQAGGPQKATQGQLYTPANVRDGIRSQMLEVALGRKYLDRLAVTFDYTQATNRQEAQTKASRMAQGEPQTAALVGVDRNEGLPAATGQSLRAADNPEIAASTPIFGVPAGSVVAFPAGQSGQWLVVRVDSRTVNATSKAPVAPQTDQQTLQELGTQLLILTANRVGVQLSPRYGVWDPVALVATQSNDQSMGIFLPPQAATAD